MAAVDERPTQAGGAGANDHRILECHEHPLGRGDRPGAELRMAGYSIGAGMRAQDIKGRATWLSNWSAFCS